LKGLFINNKKAQDSIYESGRMVFDCLKLSDKYILEYTEISIEERNIALGYDFYFFNYHPSTMYWLDTSKLKKTLPVAFTMVLEVLPNDPFVLCPENHFHGYCVLDPTLKAKNKKVFSFPRPLEHEVTSYQHEEKEIPVIGSFGFATKGKGFHHVVDAVNKEFDKAIVRINIPYGDFVPNSQEYATYLATLCKQMAKEGIEVDVTHQYMSKEELIKWCSENSLNCFLYDRNLPGLAATTDQAIVSGRPLAVSKNETFRHILDYIEPYPGRSLKESMACSVEEVIKMQHDWSPKAFAHKFEVMLESFSFLSNKALKGSGQLELPILKKGFTQFLSKKFYKYKRFLSFTKLQYALQKGLKTKDEELI
jgi:hypothetical protein